MPKRGGYMIERKKEGAQFGKKVFEALTKDKEFALWFSLLSEDTREAIKYEIRVRKGLGDSKAVVENFIIPLKDGSFFQPKDGVRDSLDNQIYDNDVRSASKLLKLYNGTPSTVIKQMLIKDAQAVKAAVGKLTDSEISDMLAKISQPQSIPKLIESLQKLGLKNVKDIEKNIAKIISQLGLELKMEPRLAAIRKYQEQGEEIKNFDTFVGRYQREFKVPQDMDLQTRLQTIAIVDATPKDIKKALDDLKIGFPMDRDRLAKEQAVFNLVVELKQSNYDVWIALSPLIQGALTSSPLDEKILNSLTSKNKMMSDYVADFIKIAENKPGALEKLFPDLNKVQGYLKESKGLLAQLNHNPHQSSFFKPSREKSVSKLDNIKQKLEELSKQSWMPQSDIKARVEEIKDFQKKEEEKKPAVLVPQQASRKLR